MIGPWLGWTEWGRTQGLTREASVIWGHSLWYRILIARKEPQRVPRNVKAAATEMPVELLAWYPALRTPTSQKQADFTELIHFQRCSGCHLWEADTQPDLEGQQVYCVTVEGKG